MLRDTANDHHAGAGRTMDCEISVVCQRAGGIYLSAVPHDPESRRVQTDIGAAVCQVVGFVGIVFRIGIYAVALSVSERLQIFFSAAGG